MLENLYILYGEVAFEVLSLPWYYQLNLFAYQLVLIYYLLKFLFFTDLGHKILIKIIKKLVFICLIQYSIYFCFNENLVKVSSDGNMSNTILYGTLIAGGVIIGVVLCKYMGDMILSYKASVKQQILIAQEEKFLRDLILFKRLHLDKTYDYPEDLVSHPSLTIKVTSNEIQDLILYSQLYLQKLKTIKLTFFETNILLQWNDTKKTDLICFIDELQHMRVIPTDSSFCYYPYFLKDYRKLYENLVLYDNIHRGICKNFYPSGLDLMDDTFLYSIFLDTTGLIFDLGMISLWGFFKCCNIVCGTPNPIPFDFFSLGVSRLYTKCYNVFDWFRTIFGK